MKLEEEIKQKQFKSEFEKGAVNIIYTYNWIDSKNKDFFKNYDITPQQYNILRILRGQHPKPSTVNLLKERMLDKMCDASRMTERLRLKNLVERQICSADRRSVDVVITKNGLDLLNQIDKDILDFHQMLFAHLSTEEMSQLNILLDKLRG